MIASIKDDNGLSKCLTSGSRIIFILYGNICNICDLADVVKSSDRIAMVHLDLTTGLSSKKITVDFLKKYTQADGIITTTPTLIKRAWELGLYTILRLFIIDSMAYENIERQAKSAKPDLLKILPALMSKVISIICKASAPLIIADGLISDKKDVRHCFRQVLSASLPQMKKSGFCNNQSRV